MNKNEFNIKINNGQKSFKNGNINLNCNLNDSIGEINDCSFYNCYFRSDIFNYGEFINCKFNNCFFEEYNNGDVYGGTIDFIKFNFISCKFNNVIFNSWGLILRKVNLWNNVFISCKIGHIHHNLSSDKSVDYSGNKFENCDIENVGLVLGRNDIFTNNEFNVCRIADFNLDFIKESTFNNLKFTNCNFKHIRISGSTFRKKDSNPKTSQITIDKCETDVLEIKNCNLYNSIIKNTRINNKCDLILRRVFNLIIEDMNLSNMFIDANKFSKSNDLNIRFLNCKNIENSRISLKVIFKSKFKTTNNDKNPLVEILNKLNKKILEEGIS